MAEGSDERAVVLDTGTGFVKCGYAGANFPTAVFPTVLGRPVLRAGATKTNTDNAARLSTATGGTAQRAEEIELKDLMLGDETISHRHVLEMTAPVRNGVVRKMDDMCLLWDYAFSQKMKITPADHMLSVSEAPIASDRARNELFEIMFEKFGFKGMQSTQQGVLTLYAAGVTTGIAVDAGEGVTHCTPVYDGYGIKKADRRVDIGGYHVTDNLVRLLQRRGYSFHTSSDFELVKAIKEKFCYAAADFEHESKLANETTVLEKQMVLPDNTTITIGKERFEATELLFDPMRMSIESPGLSVQVWNSIQAADLDVRSALYENVILAGGSSMFPGLPTRLENDLRKFFIEKSLRGDASKINRFKLKLHDAPRRKHMTFLGGACYAELTAGMTECWLTKEQYAEGGAALVTRMFSSG